MIYSTLFDFDSFTQDYWKSDLGICSAPNEIFADISINGYINKQPPFLWDTWEEGEELKSILNVSYFPIVLKKSTYISVGEEDRKTYCLKPGDIFGFQTFKDYTMKEPIKRIDTFVESDNIEIFKVENNTLDVFPFSGSMLCHTIAACFYHRVIEASLTGYVTEPIPY